MVFQTVFAPAQFTNAQYWPTLVMVFAWSMLHSVWLPCCAAVGPVDTAWNFTAEMFWCVWFWLWLQTLFSRWVQERNTCSLCFQRVRNIDVTARSGQEHLFSVSRCRGQARRCRVRSRVLYWEFFSCHTTLSVSEGIVLHGNGVHIFVMPFVVLNLCLGMRQDCPTDTGAGENLFGVTIEKESNNMS